MIDFCINNDYPELSLIYWIRNYQSNTDRVDNYDLVKLGLIMDMIHELNHEGELVKLFIPSELKLVYLLYDLVVTINHIDKLRTNLNNS